MSDNARFELKSQGLEVVIEGDQAFVSAQLELMRSTIESELRAARAVADRTTGGAAPAATPSAAPAAAPAPAATPAPAPAPAAAAPATPAPAATPEPAAPKAPATSGGVPSLEEFHKKHLRRKGRGMIQDSILLFAYYLREYKGVGSITTENVNTCFSMVGIEPPGHMANTLGLLKRSKGFFGSPTRGHYALTNKGEERVNRMLRGY